MIRPGMQNPGVGAQRTADLRRRLQQLMQQQSRGRAAAAMPRLGGGIGRRPAAGPGVRQFSSGRGPLQPAALEALTARFGGEVVPFMRPVPGLPEQAQGGALQSLPDPAVGPLPSGDPGDPNVFHPLSNGSGPDLGPSQPLSWSSAGLGGGTQQAVFPDTTSIAGGMGAGLETLIPLGRGAYFDTGTGQIYGSGSGRINPGYF